LRSLLLQGHPVMQIFLKPWQTGMNQASSNKTASFRCSICQSHWKKGKAYDNIYIYSWFHTFLRHLVCSKLLLAFPTLGDPNSWVSSGLLVGSFPKVSPIGLI
jgi:hypothetical protein